VSAAEAGGAGGPASPDDGVPILHHYDFSPFAEKVRLALGLKGLRWRSVVAPSFLPKPDLVALTGGYRHIPVLQVGADVFCDTRTICRELDRRVPSPPLVRAETAGLSTAIEAWAERDLVWPIARYTSGVNAETMDPRLHLDRAELRGRAAPSIDRLKAVARRNLRQLRPCLPVVEHRLADGRPWLLPDGPGQEDLAAYHGLWFLGALAIDCSSELEPYPATRAWMARVARIGHGTSEEMAPAESLAIAARCEPRPVAPSVDDDSMPALGQRVAVRPDDYTTAAVEGTLVHVDRDDVSLRRTDPALGEIAVHFPRVGYTITER
jgi:glutathione S-transferase